MNMLQSDDSYQLPYSSVVYDVINAANNFIYICTPNLNNEIIIKALADAVQRDIEINIVLTRLFNAKNDLNQQAIEKLFNELRKRSIGNYNKLNIRWYENGNKETAEKFSSTELICADKITIIGPVVLDICPVYSNQEPAMVVDSDLVTQDYINNIFNPTYKLGKDIFQKPFKTIKTPARLILIEAVNVLEQCINILESECQCLRLARSSRAVSTIIIKLLKRKTKGNNLQSLQQNIRDLKNKPAPDLKLIDVIAVMRKAKRLCERYYQKLIPYPESHQVFGKVLSVISGWFIGLVRPPAARDYRYGA